MKRTAAVLIATFFFIRAMSQDSTRLKEMEEVTVTATRTERKLGNAAVPVRIISQKSIRQSGSLRLRDILQEQAGLFVTNSFGAGVQMQGLNPDYTLILVDGEPLVGRTGGVLDLNRVTLGNVQKVEIVKGPSSSLYGSEAMAGVINIITDRSFSRQFHGALRYGFGNPDRGWALPAGSSAYRSADISAGGGGRIRGLGIQAFLNSNYADAYSYRFGTSFREGQPVWRLGGHAHLNYRFSAKSDLSIGFRSAYDHMRQQFAVENNGGTTQSYGREANSDLNIYPIFTQRLGERVKTALKLYGTFYSGSQRLRFTHRSDSSYQDEFRQQLLRAESQTDFRLKRITLILGAGAVSDRVRSTRYEDFSSTRENRVYYAFSQLEWNPCEKFSVIAGARYDDNKLFAAALSPKLAVLYKPGKRFSVRASIGRGFKAPDFRQLYLNFTNNAAGGYSVFGAIDAVRVIRELEAQGVIAELSPDFYRLSDLRPEFSTGINFGGSFQPRDNLAADLNFFRNDIEDLIDVRQVATKSNGAQVYSYINVNRAFTQGFETELRWKPGKRVSFSSGYQYLFTADKEEWKRVKAGTIYTSGVNGAVILEKKDYRGLANRSRSMANLKVAYEKDRSFFSARLVYRSRWVVASGGSEVNDVNSEFARGFVLLNISAGRDLKQGISLQAGMDNVFNYQDRDYVPHLQGRMLYLGAQFKLGNKNNQP